MKRQRVQAVWAPRAILAASEAIDNALIEIADDGTIARITDNVGTPPEDALVLTDGVVAPGFVNAHTHIEYAAFDDLLPPAEFAQWLRAFGPINGRTPDADRAVSATLGAWELAAGGVTSLADCSNMGFAAHAAVTAGLRARVYLEVFGTADEGVLAARPDGSVVPQRNVGARQAEFDALPAAELLSYGWSPHASYTVGESLYRHVADTGLPWATHLHESPAEMELAAAGSGPLRELADDVGVEAYRHGTSVIASLQDILSAESLVIHAVHASDSDIAALAAAGAPVVTCPRSNRYLQCGTAPVPQLRAAGIAVALGTDSPASGGTHDMYAEARALVAEHRGSLGYGDAFDMATREAALALGWDDVGALAPGMQADLQLVELHGRAREGGTAALMEYGSPDAVRATVVRGDLIWSRIPGREAGVTELREAERTAAPVRARLRESVAGSPTRV